MKDLVQGHDRGRINERHQAPPQRVHPAIDQSSLQVSESFVLEKFRKEGFDSLTTIQHKALPVILRGVNSLLVAPTGSGKTEAAVLPVFSMLSCGPRVQGKIRAVYVTPLRALNNDVFRRIVKYAESENLRVEIRHGDTSTAAKRKIV